MLGLKNEATKSSVLQIEEKCIKDAVQLLWANRCTPLSTILVLLKTPLLCYTPDLFLLHPNQLQHPFFPQTGDKAFLNSSLSYLKLQHVKKNHTRIKSSQRKNWAPKTVSREIFSMDILNNTHTVTGAVIILSAVVSNSLASVVLLSVWKAVLRHTIRLCCSII